LRIIDDIFVNDEILNTKFTCDLSKCKGACCTMESAYGAPVEENEIKTIDEILPVVMEYLPDEQKKEISENGFWFEDDGQLMLKSINNRACVFVYYEGDVAKCTIEKAFNEGKVNFQKPISCHLFPIRISKFGGDVVRYEKYSECNSAVENGKETGISILEFCKDSLIRKYGEDWYNKINGRKEE